ncbi:MAG TPA: glycosyltransferase family 4 protein [Longimicrobiales bacterium]
MRITFVMPGYPWEPVGGFRVVYEYANQLVDLGHDVSVVHPRRLPNWNPPPPRRLSRRLLGRAARVVGHFWSPRPGWQWIAPGVRMLYIAELTPEHVPDADAIVATWWATAEAVLAFPPSKGSRFYLIQHHEVWGGPAERVNATWRAPLWKVVIARWLYDRAIAFDVAPDEVVHIPNALDHARFRVVRPLEDRPPRVAMLYSDLEWKGAATGIRALELAKRRVPWLRARLFGVAPRPRDLPAWIEYSRNPSQETLVAGIYNGSGIYLCPSHGEGWHLPPAEAMACGCAVVSTDIGGVRDYAEHDETAWLCPVGDAAALADGIVRLVQDDALRIRLARNGGARIREFDWKNSAAALDRFLVSRAARGVGPARPDALGDRGPRAAVRSRR